LATKLALAGTPEIDPWGGDLTGAGSGLCGGLLLLRPLPEDVEDVEAVEDKKEKHLDEILKPENRVRKGGKQRMPRAFAGIKCVLTDFAVGGKNVKFLGEIKKIAGNLYFGCLVVAKPGVSNVKLLALFCAPLKDKRKSFLGEIAWVRARPHVCA